jgi:hypothetical protein
VAGKRKTNCFRQAQGTWTVSIYRLAGVRYGWLQDLMVLSEPLIQACRTREGERLDSGPFQAVMRL